MVAAKRLDEVDAHVAGWAARFPQMDPEVEGAITRMQSVLRRLRKLDAAAFSGSDVTHEDYKTLHALLVQPFPVEATPAHLAEVCQVTRAAMTSRLDRLVGAGYVTRAVDSEDRRRVIVRPTPAGRQLWEELLEAGMAREQHLLHSLSRREMQQLNDLLRKVLLSLEAGSR